MNGANNCNRPARQVRIGWRAGLLLAGLALAAPLVIRTSDAADDKDAPAKAAHRSRSINNLKQLGLAMHNYHSSKGSFPPKAVFDKDGKALLSWRVLLLPYLDQRKLAEEIHLDEAWDSEHNKKLVESMPKVFQSGGESEKPGETAYLAFTGKGTIFDGKKGIKLLEITDGTSNTIMFVESARGVPWTKPEDLAYDPDKPLPKLGLVPEGFLSTFCDGSVRFLRSNVPEETLRALITASGGEVPGKF
jgi:Protein of unknown function (DUF1559)